MAVPKYNEMYKECLEVLSDGESHKIGDLRNAIAEKLKLTEEERSEMLPSRNKLLFVDRANWTCTYLKKAGLIENPSRGIYKITKLGKNVLDSNPNVIDNNFLSQYDSFRIFTKPKENTPVTQTIESNVPTIISDDNHSPQEILESAYSKINSELTDDILSEIMNKSPIFFEHLVVRLLTQMGYGGSLDDSAIVTKASGDEGIDGIIREDKLGFDKIYIQAKKWDLEHTVGRPEIQKFVGALAGQGATKGLFITTAKFTKEARDYVEKQHTTKVVLVDGTALAKLMIEYNLGVSVEATYSIKRIDSDFFDDSLI